MVINDVKEGKFYGLLPKKENTGMAIIVFMILVTSTWLIQKLCNKLLFSIAVCFPCSQRITR